MMLVIWSLLYRDQLSRDAVWRSLRDRVANGIITFCQNIDFRKNNSNSCLTQQKQPDQY
jgi:hypothetical protein